MPRLMSQDHFLPDFSHRFLDRFSVYLSVCPSFCLSATRFSYELTDDFLQNVFKDLIGHRKIVANIFPGVEEPARWRYW